MDKAKEENILKLSTKAERVAMASIQGTTGHPGQ